MRATLTDEQTQLQEVAADLARAGRPDSPSADERLPDDHGPSSEQLFGGFTGLAVPEDAGGVGGGLVDLALVVQQLGRHVVSTPFVDHVLAMQVALGGGLDVSGALGDARWTLASDESGSRVFGPWQAAPGSDVPKRRVAHAGTADAVVATTGHDGVVLAGLGDVQPDAATDLGRPTASVRLGKAAQGTQGGARRGLQRALPIHAAHAVGVGRGAVELAVEYANQREQFGQPIGRFQGVAHQLADAIVAVENAWSLVLYAAWSVDAGHEDAWRSVHAAAASAGEAAIGAAERGTQVHGGIGITWEAMPHVYLRRALTLATQLGDQDAHRALVGEAMLSA